MKLSKLVHGYKTLPQIFQLFLGDLVVGFQSRKNRVNYNLSLKEHN